MDPHNHQATEGRNVAQDLKKGARITGQARDRLAADLRRKYDSGQSIRALAEFGGGRGDLAVDLPGQGVRRRARQQ